MLKARFEFKPEYSHMFAWGPEQTIVELEFDTVFDLIMYCQEYEEAICGCLANVDGEIVSLQPIKA
jgi:hypothetical protein